ncbi:hypothetical protein [Bdellovibrio sp. KM01]|uniref:hypothetical protein n=1 Tax=Bdellovibrio sp. KM01 TaxID=2748865 RepID=UPI0015E978BC|nr:hypothetical protein [Bdellovibrio sp. KM01]QLY24143.1 hypothetical protein HW988_11760 [Bdellovibrio sp. KM01]
MSFKRKFSLLFASVLMISSVGCSDFINGQETKEEELHFSNEKLACLQGVPETLKRLTNGDGEKEEIRTSVDCLRQALMYFQKKTYGAQGNAYTVEEMRRFFSKYFLKENVVTPEFALELMKIKKAILGGSSNNLTKEEITRLIDVLAIVRDEAVDLAPHIKLLLLGVPVDQANWQQVSAAVEQLRVGLQRLLEKTETSRSDYSFEDGKRALKGFKEFIKDEDTDKNVTQWLPVVEVVKNVLMGQEAQLATYTQWKGSLNSLIDLYGLVLKYHYIIHNFDMSTQPKVREVSQFIGQAIDLIEGAPQITTRGMIPLEDIDNLITTILGLPQIQAIAKIRPISIQTLYRAAILRLLEPGRNGDSRGILGLEKKHIVALRREYNVWRLVQNFVDSQLVAGRSADALIAKDDLLEKYAKFNAVGYIKAGLSTDPYEHMALENAWKDYGDLLNSAVLISYNAKGRIEEFNDAHASTTTWKSLTTSNLMRTMSRGLLLAYGSNTSGELTKAAMQTSGLVTWYEDFKELMFDLKAFDPRTGNTGERSFQEANFFTFSGNGDSYMNQRETFEFVSLLFSAGLSSSGSVYNDMLLAGCGKANGKSLADDVDPLGFYYLNEQCFQTNFRLNFSKYFDNLPEMAKFVANLKPEQWKEFYTTLRYLAYVSPKEDQGFVEVANIRTMVTVLHYMESVMLIYDGNRNQTLSLDEVYAASPRFLPYIKEMKKDIPFDTLLNQGFAYMVFYGKEGSAAEIAWFQAQKIWLDEADRLNLMRAMKAIKDMQLRAAAKKLQKKAADAAVMQNKAKNSQK